MNLKGQFATAIRAVAVMVMASCTLVGCRKEEMVQAPAAEKPAVASRMEDPVYNQKLQVQRAEMKRTVGTRNEIARKLAAKEEAMQKKLGTTDAAQVAAALEADPEWKSLQEQLKAAEAAFEANRQKTMAVVRERMKKDISK